MSNIGYLKRGQKDGIQQGMRWGAQQERIEAIKNMLRYGVPKEKILMDYTKEEVGRAEERLLLDEKLRKPES